MSPLTTSFDNGFTSVIMEAGSGTTQQDLLRTFAVGKKARNWSPKQNMLKKKESGISEPHTLIENHFPMHLWCISVHQY